MGTDTSLLTSEMSHTLSLSLLLDVILTIAVFSIICFGFFFFNKSVCACIASRLFIKKVAEPSK